MKFSELDVAVACFVLAAFISGAVVFLDEAQIRRWVGWLKESLFSLGVVAFLFCWVLPWFVVVFVYWRWCVIQDWWQRRGIFRD